MEPIRRVLTRGATDSVHHTDAVRLDVRMLPVLPEDAMLALLSDHLKRLGFELEPSEALVKQLADGIEVRLLPDGSAVEIRHSTTEELSEEQNLALRGEEDPDADAAAEAALEQQVQAALAAKKAKATERATAAALAALTAVEPQVRELVQTALNGVYREALEQKARMLGVLESVREHGDIKGSYEVTVVVKA